MKAFGHSRNGKAVIPTVSDAGEVQLFRALDKTVVDGPPDVLPVSKPARVSHLRGNVSDDHICALRAVIGAALMDAGGEK